MAIGHWLHAGVALCLSASLFEHRKTPIISQAGSQKKGREARRVPKK